MARLTVRLTPRGGRDALDGWGEDGAGRRVLKARVSAPPADGAANEALIALLAKALGHPRGAVRLAAGATARIKRIEVEGMTDEALAAALDAALAKP